ncbi:MAG: hypothetical protein RSB95_03465 [Bacilli bacterium]
MIIYGTKQTIERYKITLPSELSSPLNKLVDAIIKKEGNDKLFEWGAKLFYFDKRKCVQVVNFATKFTLFLVDIKIDEMGQIGNMIACYLIELYKKDKKMINALKKMFQTNPITCFSKLTDKSMIATLNRTQLSYEDGDCFYTYIKHGVLDTIKINHELNFVWMSTMKINGKTEYILPAEKLKEIVLARFGD